MADGHEPTWALTTQGRRDPDSIDAARARPSPVVRAAIERLGAPTPRVRLNGGWQSAVPPRVDHTHGPEVQCGPQPRVPHEFIVKLHSRCNLACDYCYMYTSADQSWGDRPGVIGGRVVEAVVHRVSGHARRHQLDTVMVALHGGEPLLAGPDVIDRVARGLRAAFAELPTRLQIVLQTNGVLLDERFLDVFLEHAITVGVSLDGSPQAHDRRRPTKRGDGSHATVTARLALLRRARYRHLYGGLLCTVDLANPPVETYEALLEHEPPVIDFLLPHATWDTPPPGGAEGGYAGWLIAVFDRWYDSPRRETGIRLFDSIIDLCLGGESTTAIVGLADGVSPLVVETDGAIEWDDSLKVVAPGAAATGYNVIDDDFEEVAIAAYSVSAACQRCAVVDVCGGGLRTHRYRAANGFDNPSVYCHDLRKLIDHVHDRLHRDVPTLVAVSR